MNPSVLARWRVRAGYPVALIYFLLAQPTERSLGVGALLGLLGLAVRAAAAGHLHKREALAISGPYAWTRNPLYFGSGLMALGLMLAGHSLLAAALVFVYFLIFYPAVMMREEEELRAHFGAAFDDYAAAVPLFWPRQPRTKRIRAPFSWELYRQNREYMAALGVLLSFAILAAKLFWRVKLPF